MLADDARFADDHARAVIDEEIPADRRAGMDIDARVAMRVLGHHARQERHLQRVQTMRQPVNADRLEGGIGQHDLLAAARGGVAVIGGLNVGFQRFGDAGQRVEKRRHHLARLFRPFGQNHAEHVVHQQRCALQIFHNLHLHQIRLIPLAREDVRIHRAAHQLNPLHHLVLQPVQARQFALPHAAQRLQAARRPLNTLPLIGKTHGFPPRYRSIY